MRRRPLEVSVSVRSPEPWVLPLHVKEPGGAPPSSPNVGPPTGAASGSGSAVGYAPSQLKPSNAAASALLPCQPVVDSSEPHATRKGIEAKAHHQRMEVTPRSRSTSPAEDPRRRPS